MNKKIFENSRFCPKGDTEANWNKAIGFVPLEREIIIYKADEKHPNPRIKIGDGKTGIKDLPFVTENIQANYEQNDPSAKDYIKNRPFYTATKTKEIVNCTYTSENIDELLTIAIVSLSETLEEIPAMIDVTFDGMEYKGLFKQSIDGATIFGNASIGVDSMKDTGEPFIIELFSNDPVAYVLVKETTSNTHSLIIEVEDEVVIKLPEKYLPDSVLEIASDLQIQITEVKDDVTEVKDNVDNLPKIVYVDGLPPYINPLNRVDGLEPLLNSGAAVGDYVIFKNGDFGRVTTYRHPLYGTTTLWVNVNPIGSGGKVWISNENGLDNDGIEHYLHDNRLNNGDFVLKPDSGKLWSVAYRTGTGSWCLQPVKNTIIDYLDQRIAELAGSVTTVTFNIEEAGHSVKLQNLKGITKINWGDGTINSELSHTFAIAGEYKCKIYDVTSIGDEAFRWTYLTSIIIPNSVTSIGDEAFRWTYLTSIIIPNSVTSIGDYAFGYCLSLTSAIFKNPIPITYNSQHPWFGNCTSLTHIYVPYGCKQAYIDKWAADGAEQAILDLIVESDREAMMSDLNEISNECVKFTDYATANKAGVSKFLSTRGIGINANGEAYIERADKSLIEGKSNPYRPIVPANQDIAWKMSAIDNKEEWTDEDKAKACETIGAAKKEDIAGFQEKRDESLKTADKTIIGAINEINAKVGIGGGGGNVPSNNAVLTLTNTSGWLSKSIAENADCEISVEWSSIEGGLSTGNGIIRVYVNDAIKTSYEVSQGGVTVNVGKYLTVGTNKVQVEIMDIYGNVKVVTYSINSVIVSVSSYFDGTIAYTGDITYSYTPVGAIEKTVHFLIDGKEAGTQTVTASNREQSYIIPAQAHGSHTFEVYFTGKIDNQTVESNHLYYDLICYEEGKTTPIIAVPHKFSSVKQYSTVAIPYSVYTPNILTSAIELKDGTKTVQNLTVDRTQQIWSYKAVVDGTANLSIVCGDTVKPISFDVILNAINVSAETENLELYLTSSGRSNNEENPLVWSYGAINAELTDFNLVSDGWQLDEGKNTVLRVTGDARVYIPFNIFGSDFRSTGKTIEFEFATRDVLNYDADILSAWDGERGIKITAQKALLKSEQSEIFTQYKENETVRVAFTVEKKAENRLLAIYINGIMSGVVQYPSDDDFSQSSPVGISIGSNDCTTDIYCIRVYSNNLTRYQILDNWIADTQDAETMFERYNRNNIFDDYGDISVAKIPSYLPYMVLNVSNYFDLPQSKGDKKTVSGRYVDTINPSRAFTFTGAEIDVQGTSSQYYSRKNYKIKFKNGFIVNGVASENYQLRSSSMPTNEFTFKADVASSEGANNVELVRLYDDTCPVKTPPQQADSRVRQGIEGYPCLMFYGNGNTLKFLGKYNFNNDKSTGEVFGFKSGDESWEILQNNTEMVIWKDDDFTGDAWKQSFEARYPDKSTDTEKLNEFASWLKSTDTTAVSSEEEKQARIEKFKTEFGNYANVNAMLFNYIFTEMFLMVDNRAKNAFPTRYDADGKWLILPYDYDTAIGINNEGELKFGYELEDIDLINGNNVFNGQDSVLYVNMRLAFADEIMQMYKDLRTGDIFSYEEIEKRFEEHQSVWGEAVFNEDARFKYIEPLINEGNKTYLPMLQGAKAEQRKWWLYNRFRYLDSKYNAGDALEDYIMLRSYAVADIEVTPYADIYATAKFDSALVQKRALRGKSYTLENPLSGGRDAVVSIYSASQLSAIGDLSGLKVGMADFSKATKLSALKVGDGAEDYDNPNLTDLTIGNLTLLRTLDVRNCSALTQAVDISGCTNIEEVYFDGTATTGVTLQNGGNLKKLHLPATVTNLTLLNQKALTEFVMPSYENVTTLRLENINNNIINSREILNQIKSTSRVRLIGVDWNVATANEIFALMDKLDTFRGLDENGNNLDKAVVSGKIHIPSLTREELSAMNERYPNITIDYEALSVKVQFYNEGALVNEQWVVTGEAITAPENPTKESTVQYNFVFKGWSLDGETVVEVGTAGTQNLTYYALYNEELRYYTVRFLNIDGTVLQTTQVAYGEVPVYVGDTPVDATDEEAEFNGWNAEIVAVTGDVDYTATYYVPPRFNYALTNNNTAYSVAGIGTVTDTDIVIPATYKGLPVTNIGAWAFQKNTNITSVVVGRNVATIGMAAFTGCTSLISVELPESITSIGDSVFSQCSALQNCNIPSGLTTIPNGIFNQCGSLKNVVIRDGVTSIGDSAFAHCSSLTEIEIPDSVTSIGEYAINGCSGLTELTIPNSVTSIGEGAVQSCPNLTSITLPDSVTSFGTKVFWRCSSLTEIIVPHGATDLSGMFYDCSSLVRVTIPDSVTKIGTSAFENCSSLTEISIPDWVTSIGESAFRNCSSLESVTIPESVTEIGQYAFFSNGKFVNIYYAGDIESWNSISGLDGLLSGSTKKNLYLNNEIVTNLVIPDSVTSISGSAFKNLNITSVEMPASITSIGGSAFYGCASLASVNTLGHITHIGQLTFLNCSSLSSITIPASVTKIDHQAFNGCRKLTTVTVEAETPPTLETSSFNKAPLEVIYVPAESVDTYKAATNWSAYADKIQAMPTEGLAYTLNSDNASYTCSGIGTDTATDIVIASQYEGLPVTAIGNSAFSNKSQVKSIYIHDGVTTIGTSAFYNCYRLTRINIPNSVTSIGRLAFDGADSFKNVYITDLASWCNISYGSYEASPMYEVGGNLYLNNQLVTEVTIPESITALNPFAFYMCKSLTRINIPNSVTSIGQQAFYNCTNLENVVLSDSLTKLDNYLFNGCTSLTRINIPNRVTSIGIKAFYNCTNLESITVNATTPPTLEASLVFPTSITAIYVPAESVDAYKAATNWSAYADKIQAIQ